MPRFRSIGASVLKCARCPAFVVCDPGTVAQSQHVHEFVGERLGVDVDINVSVLKRALIAPLFWCLDLEV